MAIAPYEYPVEQCDVPEVRRGALKQYRDFRLKCLEYLRGEADSSVMNQVHGLAWYTAVFRTLNEARRIESDRPVNGATWELITAGYANLMALGIRRLVDRDPRTDSVWNVVMEVAKRPELLCRENFICYDGLPHDYQAAMERQVRSGAFDQGKAAWMSTKGPDAWGTSQLLHEAFDAVAGYPAKRKRLDTVQPGILASLKAHLEHETIQAVCTTANKTIAHAERLTKDSNVVPLVTYNMVDQALQNIVQVASFLSTHFFYDAAFGSLVPVPQYDVLESLDQPWVKTENLPALHAHWHQVSETLSKWADSTDEAFLPPKPGGRRGT
jgi:hypothetical protein